MIQTLRVITRTTEEAPPSTPEAPVLPVHSDEEAAAALLLQLSQGHQNLQVFFPPSTDRQQAKARLMKLYSILEREYPHPFLIQIG